jgi:hypothetical protein
MDTLKQNSPPSFMSGGTQSANIIVYGSRFGPWLAAYIALLLALAIDLILLADIPLLAEGPPLLEGIFLLRMALLAAAGGILVWGVGRLNERYLEDEEIPQPSRNALPAAFWRGAIWFA